MYENDSESIAMNARNDRNDMIINSKDIYLPKSKWDNYDIAYRDDITNNDSNDDYSCDDYEVIKSNIIKPYSGHCYYLIEYDQSLISDLKMRIKLNQFTLEDNHKSAILNMELIFIIRHVNGIRYCLLMETNLILANILGKKIKHYDDIIEIPIIFFDMVKSEFKGKFPLFMMKNGWLTLEIHLGNTVKNFSNGINFSYRKYPYQDTTIKPNIFDPEVIQDVLIIDQIFMDVDDRYQLYWHGICKVLIIQFKEVNSYDNGIQRVKLSLNDSNPIIWEHDEIIKYKILGYTYYCIPLSPEIRSKKNIKKIFSNKVNGYGINSCVDNAEISFDYFSNDFSC